MNENMENKTPARTTICVGRASIAVSALSADGTATYEPYAVKNGISLAANMRQALKDTAALSQAGQRVTVMVDSRAMLVPTDLYDEQQQDVLFRHSFPKSGADSVMSNVLPDLNCVALYAINKDLKMVIDDRFGEARYICATAPVWRYLHQRSFTGTRSKLYGYFHDGVLDVFSFQQNRFKFYNTFDTERTSDALYYLLYVWKQLMMRPEHDELHLVGTLPGEGDAFAEELRQYLKRVYIIHPAGEFNRSPVTQIPDMPFNLMTLYIKGR